MGLAILAGLGILVLVNIIIGLALYGSVFGPIGSGLTYAFLGFAIPLNLVLDIMIPIICGVIAGIIARGAPSRGFIAGFAGVVIGYFIIFLIAFLGSMLLTNQMYSPYGGGAYNNGGMYYGTYGGTSGGSNWCMTGGTWNYGGQGGNVQVNIIGLENHNGAMMCHGRYTVSSAEGGGTMDIWWDEAGNYDLSTGGMYGDYGYSSYGTPIAQITPYSASNPILYLILGILVIPIILGILGGVGGAIMSALLASSVPEPQYPVQSTTIVQAPQPYMPAVMVQAPQQTPEAPPAKIVCPACKTLNEPTSMFCQSCGTRLKS